MFVLLSALAWAQAPVASPPDSPSQPLARQTQAKAPDEPVDPSTLLPEPSPMPEGKASLIGGTLSRLDRVKDELTVQVFGGNRMKVLFDGRTRIYRDGSRASFHDLQEGQRVYLDTLLDGNKVFAKNIRLVSRGAMGESSGQVLSYRSDKGELLVRDAILPQPLKFRVTSSTEVLRNEQRVSVAELRPGSLVSIKLRPDGEGRGIARQVSILAVPGGSFIFVGHVIFLDMHDGLLVLVDPRDKKRYEVHFDPALPVNGQVRVGSDVTVTTDFDGTRYFARSIMVNSPATE